MAVKLQNFVAISLSMDFSNQKILVTGGAGFIGSHLVDSLVEARPKALHVVDNLFLGRRENLNQARLRYPNLRFHKLDAANGGVLRNLIRRKKIGVVFNLATKALGYSFDSPLDAFHVNTQIVGHLLESLRLGEIRHLIHFSSSEAYGNALRVPMGEEHPLRPTTSYAAGKASADLLIRSYQESFGLCVLTLRPFNNYGPRQNENLYAGVIPLTIKRLLKGETPVVYGDGLQTRDFMFVADTVRLALMLARRENVYGKVVNLGTGCETPIRDIVKRLCSIAGYKGRVKKTLPRAGDVRRHCADISLLRSLVGKMALRPLEEGLTETWEWYARLSTKKY
ncbi:MAG: GDP-mannose 4,6-dehydratase [bacterium]|nr:GDP-mannose 4,6-dehydratase [bacterium]